MHDMSQEIERFTYCRAHRYLPHRTVQNWNSPHLLLAVLSRSSCNGNKPCWANGRQASSRKRRVLSTMLIRCNAFLTVIKNSRMQSHSFSPGTSQACEELHMLVNSAPVVVFSFSDCPWCVAAKALLAEYGLQKVLRQETAGTDTNAVGDENGQVQLALHEIDKMGKRGKRIRAALATVTGRTSMPNVFISGRSVGGFTDGYATEREGSDRIDGSIFVQSDAIPIQAILSSEEASSLANIGKWTWRRSAGLESLHNSGDLRVMLQKARAIMHTTRRAS